MTFDPNKPFKTRDGRDAHCAIYGTGTDSFLIGGFRLVSGEWRVGCWNINGRFINDSTENPRDLVNIEEEKPMRKPLDLTKPLRTSDCEGRVTIYCVDATGVHGRVDYRDGSSALLSWHLDGSFSTSGPMNNDLINEPESTVRWVNIHEDERGILSLDGLFNSKDQADALCYHDQRIGRIRIDNYRRFDE